jgi:hypothetical protein
VRSGRTLRQRLLLPGEATLPRRRPPLMPLHHRFHFGLHLLTCTSCVGASLCSARLCGGSCGLKRRALRLQDPHLVGDACEGVAVRVALLLHLRKNLLALLLRLQLRCAVSERSAYVLWSALPHCPSRQHARARGSWAGGALVQPPPRPAIRPPSFGCGTDQT